MSWTCKCLVTKRHKEELGLANIKKWRNNYQQLSATRLGQQKHLKKMSFKVDLMPYLNLKVVSKLLANSILWRKKTTFGPFEKDILELMLIKTFSHRSTRLKNGLGLSLPCIDSISQNMRSFHFFWFFLIFLQLTLFLGKKVFRTSCGTNIFYCRTSLPANIFYLLSFIFLWQNCRIREARYLVWDFLHN